MIKVNKSYKSLNGCIGTVLRYALELGGLYEVKYSDGVIDYVNSNGLATIRDNINRNEYDLILNETISEQTINLIVSTYCKKCGKPYCICRKPYTDSNWD